MGTLIKRILFPYWRLRRGMTLGAQGIVIRDGRDVLLIRHGYRPGWHFPGGGVEWNETLLTALAREVREETGVIVRGEPRLHGIFANFHAAPCDHVAVYLVEDWEQPSVPSPSMEIREQAFFPLSDLPIDVVGGAQRRIAELFQGHPIAPHW